MALVPDSTVHCSRPPARNIDLSSSDHAQGPWVGFIYIELSKLLKDGPGMPKQRLRSLRSLGLASLYPHAAAPGSINSKRITAKPAREGSISMCACTEPVRTGIGAVCVEYGRPKWLITMLNHTNKHPWYRKMFVFYFWHPMLVRPSMKRLFRPKAKNGLIINVTLACCLDDGQ